MPASSASPSWLGERGRAVLEAYETDPGRTWARSGVCTTSLRNLDLDALEPRRYEPVGSEDELPSEVRDALDGEPGALIVQRGASTIYIAVDDELTAQGVIVMPLE